MKLKKICFKEQYKLLYLALMEAFSGPSGCMTTEKFVGAYQEQICYTDCGDVVQKSSHCSEFEVILTCNTNQMNYYVHMIVLVFSVIIMLKTTENNIFFKHII